MLRTRTVMTCIAALAMFIGPNLRATTTVPGRTQKIPRALAAAEGLLDQNEQQGQGVPFRWARSLPWKEATDNCLLPMFVLREIGSRKPTLLCRTLAYPYGGLGRPKIAGSASGAKKVIAALSGLRVGPHRYVRFKLIEANLFPIDMLYPVMLCWRGAVGAQGGVARICWYEPILSDQSTAYGDSPINSGLRWNMRRVVDEAHLGAGFSAPYVSNFRAGGPLLNLGFGAYGVTDSVALWPVVTLRPQIVPAASSAAGDIVRLVGPLNWRGSRERREQFQFSGGRLVCIKISQPPVPLRQYVGSSPTLIRYTSRGKPFTAKFWPHFAKTYLKSGRTILVNFGSEPGTMKTNPRTIVIRRNSVRRFYARFCSLKYIEGPLPSTPWRLSRRSVAQKKIIPHHGRIANRGRSTTRKKLAFAPPRATPGWRLREKFRQRVFQCLDRRDWGAMAQALGNYRKLLRREGVPYCFYVFDVEILTGRACSFDDPHRASAMVRRFLRPAYLGLRPDQIARRIAQCVDQYRYGLAAVAADALRGDPKANGRLRNWAAKTAQKLMSLIARIKAGPAPYRRYAKVNRMFRWRRVTKQNEIIASAASGAGAG